VVVFRDYEKADQAACLAIFDANCPEFFAPNERDDYLLFLDANTPGYKVCTSDQEVKGAYGIYPLGEGAICLNWILLDPRAQGLGIGSAIMAEVMKAAQSAGVASIQIAASHKSAAFFSRFGAVEIKTTEHGWGKDMHRVDMEISV